MTRGERASLIVAIATVVISVVVSIPSFIALRSKHATVLYETASSTMVLPETSDRIRVREVLRQNKLPDASARILITNRGDNSAAETIVALAVAGEITATRIIPNPESRPAWVTIVRDSLPAVNRVRYRLLNLATGPGVIIDVSYIADSEEPPTWEVYSDGRQADEVASISSLPQNVNSISFRTPLLVFGAGICLAFVLFIGFKAKDNQKFRDALMLVTASIVPGSTSLLKDGGEGWQGFYGRVLLGLSATPGVEVLSVSGGRAHSISEANVLWDARIKAGHRRLNIDCHTSAQRWPGLVGSSDQQEYYCALLASSAIIDAAALVLALDCPLEELNPPSNFKTLCETVRAGKPTFEYYVIHGTSEDVVREIIALRDDSAFGKAE